ncbi:transglutaminase-like cysteine peptidase [uncultured Desulfobulbus sp.]|uniref:transglutaminase-like cysteine peptidase n=1 Tax=uncultured Desulfobulbus sp. TaxID=239745 RepID=UPI0029C6FAB0|nr:transglutaminase-like cysteine peptidase [uncultured Desulfobulbus sp.]
MPIGGLSSSLIQGTARWLLLILLVATAAPVGTEESFVINERTLRLMEKRYGTGARTRLLGWQNLIQTTGGDDRAQLERVNRFFNAMAFVDDDIHWKKADYWATPIEFLASEGGDCEDFAIAKYFTLIKLGIAEDRLTLTYVKAVRLNKAHMVLTYYPSPGAEPLVLDNLIETIQPSSQRTDLLPVYSLNGSGLWLAKQRGKGKMIGDSDRLKRWRELLDRMTNEMEQEEEAP